MKQNWEMKQNRVKQNWVGTVFDFSSNSGDFHGKSHIWSECEFQVLEISVIDKIIKTIWTWFLYVNLKMRNLFGQEIRHMEWHVFWIRASRKTLEPQAMAVALSY